MSGVNINVDAEFSEIREYLAKVEELGTDAEDLFEQIGSRLLASTKDRFESSTAPDGSAWKPVKRGGTPLYDTGNLVNKMTYNATATQVEVGSNREYAAIHQFGGQAGRGHAVTIDARPFLGIGDNDEAEVVGILTDFIESLAA